MQFFIHGKYIFWKNKYGKSFKIFFKQPLEKAPALKESCSATIVIVIYVGISGFSLKYLKWLAQEM